MTTQTRERCFACDRVIRDRNPLRADTRDAQLVFVGSDCYRKIVNADDDGYQPPKGGPRLFALPAGAAPAGR
ncbi:hypothetical protein [Ramlibacter albus]|uniref:hypothetical protein n=1 Tax=Ramlibacter albus TaxID=2079448 RepID=UPI00164E7C9C|nr:hypothetical protein [Ramlibacter albus]